MNCLHVNTVDTGWKESIWICQHCRYRFIWYSKCFYSKDELPSCRHCRYWMKGIHPKAKIQVHLVFEMFLLKRWTVFMSTLFILDERNPSEYVNTVDTGSSGIRNVSTQKMNCLHVDTVDTNREWIRSKDTGSSGIRNVSTQKMNCLHVYTVDTGWKESIRICQHCRYRFIWYSKCFYSKDELPSCRHCRYKSRMDSKQRYRFIWYSKCFYSKDELPSCLHCRYWMKGIHPNMSTLSIQVHLVFEMFLLKRWTAFMSTLSIQIENGFEAKIQVHLVFEMFLLKRWTVFMSTLSILDERNPSEYVNTDTGSSSIRNVSTQKMNCLHVNTVDTGWKEWICQHCRYRFIWYSKCFYSKDELPSCRHCRYTSRMDSKQIYEFHPVFEMYYWRQRACRHCRYKVVWVENLQYWMKGIHPNMSTLSIQGCLSRKSSIQHCWYRFIWYSKCFYSKDELPSCQHCRYWMKGIHLNMSTLSIQVHLVFEMFLLKRWTAFMSTLSILKQR